MLFWPVLAGDARDARGLVRTRPAIAGSGRQTRFSGQDRVAERRETPDTVHPTGARKRGRDELGVDPHFAYLRNASRNGACCATHYNPLVIKSLKHKGLQIYYETGSKAGIQAKHAGRLRLQLAALDTARVIDDMDVPGYRLHPLKGRAKNRWSIWVSGNWRLTFEFKDGNAYILDYEDYH